VFERAGVSTGIQESISRVLHYVIVLLACFIALEHIGLDLTALAAAGAVLMVGIGFGLQNVTSNFISGLILLFERPIEVDDFVEVGGVLGRVRAVRARSTIVDTQDNVSIIVPNSNFISENVTNWSYRDPKTRIHIGVGVSYGSDVDLVREALLGVGAEHAEVLNDPKPSVQFREFGDSSLNFVLLCWIREPHRQFFIRSDLNFAIVRAFREKGIEIPFPQRDLHLRSAIPIRTEG
jgi:small-conductance mechanosensitive channel